MPFSSEVSQAWVGGMTIGEVLARTVAGSPEREALIFPGLDLRWTWREFGDQVERLARALVARGVVAGEHVGIWSMNTPEWVVLQFATARIGAVLVNINPAYRLHELEEALGTADIATLVVGCPFKDSDFVAMVHAVGPEVAAAEGLDWTAAGLPRLRRVIALGQRPGDGWLGFSQILDGPLCEVDELHRRERGISASDVANIQFTSGTTGLPKAAMLTHSNLLLNAFHVGERLRYTAADRVCIPVPFYHCFGCVLGNMVCVVHGATMVVPAPSFDPGATLSAIVAERCTSVYGVPTMFVRMLEHPSFSGLDLSSLRTGIMSGAPCPLPLMEQVVERMGAREICIGYGQTEASPIITFTSADDPLEVRCGTVGRPIPGVEVKLVDPLTRAEPAPGEPGELCARGHDVMAGYYRNPEATARAIDVDGWLHTGDLARRREDGNFRIVGRSKELIIRGGENIYPPEVEEFLHHHPDVAEVAVLGLPDPRYGEIVAAWIVPRAGTSLEADAIREYCQGRIARFKVPQHITVVPALPRTVTGKVRKHLLKERAIVELGLDDAASTPTA